MKTKVDLGCLAMACGKIVAYIVFLIIALVAFGVTIHSMSLIPGLLTGAVIVGGLLGVGYGLSAVVKDEYISGLRKKQERKDK